MGMQCYPAWTRLNMAEAYCKSTARLARLAIYGLMYSTAPCQPTSAMQLAPSLLQCIVVQLRPKSAVSRPNPESRTVDPDRSTAPSPWHIVAGCAQCEGNARAQAHPAGPRRSCSPKLCDPGPDNRSSTIQADPQRSSDLSPGGTVRNSAKPGETRRNSAKPGETLRNSAKRGETVRNSAECGFPGHSRTAPTLQHDPRRSTPIQQL